MHDGDHAVRRASRVRQQEAAAVILRLFDNPDGEECSMLCAAFGKRLDALEREALRRAYHQWVAMAFAVTVLMTLYASGMLSFLVDMEDTREL